MKSATASYGWIVVWGWILAAGQAQSASLWWDSTTANQCDGTTAGTWQDGVASWAASASPGVAAPIGWVNNSDANFTVHTTATVNNVTANSITNGGTVFAVQLNPGTGPLTLGAGGIVFANNGGTARALTIGADVVLETPQGWKPTQLHTIIVTGKVSGAALTAHIVNPYTDGPSLLFTNTAAAGNTFNGLSVYRDPFNYEKAILSSPYDGTMGRRVTARAGGTPLGTNTVTLGPIGGSPTNSAILEISSSGGGSTITTIPTLNVGCLSAVRMLAYTNDASTNRIDIGTLTRTGQGLLLLNASQPLSNQWEQVYVGNIASLWTNGIVPPWIMNMTLAFLTTNSAGLLVNAPTVGDFTVSRAGQVVALPSGAYTLSGDNSCAGWVTHSGGGLINLNGKTLKIGDGSFGAMALGVTGAGSSGPILTNSATSGGLDFMNGEAIIYNNLGTSTLYTPLHTASRATIMTKTTVILASTNFSQGDVVYEGILALNPPQDITAPNRFFSHVSALRKDGPATLTLTGNSTISQLNANGGTLIVGSGAKVNAGGITGTYMSSALVGSGATNCALSVTGPGTVLQCPPAAYVYVGGSANNCASNFLVITNGAMLSAGTLMVGGGASLTTTVSRTSVLNGGVLELATGFGFSSGMTGCSITNNRGVYQFTQIPTFTLNSGSLANCPISLTDGVISFRNMASVNVTNNYSTTLSNIVYSGANAFRLNNSTNTGPATQSYTFTTNSTPLGSANFAGVEFVSGNTAWTNGTIAIDAGGWMTFSNTTAALGCIVTNNGGLLTVIGSAVTFKTNLTLVAGTLTMDSTNVTVQGKLTLPASLALNVSETASAFPATLFNATGGLAGSTDLSGWAVTPSTRRAVVVGNTVVLQQRLPGLLFYVQ